MKMGNSPGQIRHEKVLILSVNTADTRVSSLVLLRSLTE